MLHIPSGSIFRMGPFKKGPMQESDRILQLIKDKKALDKEQREEERHVELMGALGAISSGLPPTFHGGGS